MPKVQKFLANESGIHKRRFDRSRVPSATCPTEKLLPIRLRPDFSVVFEGYGILACDLFPVGKRLLVSLTLAIL